MSFLKCEQYAIAVQKQRTSMIPPLGELPGACASAEVSLWEELVSES